MEEKDPGPGRQQVNGCSQQSTWEDGCMLGFTISGYGVEHQHGVLELRMLEE